ncbi:MAG: hypothetical protein DI539_24865 [Flavobacterium psychrophilum]|nr:MAG: hypothetical protein DI539_24865 [Flavobacterium psychrophilum]
MKRASIIKFKETQVFLFQSTSTMMEGGGINTEPYIKLEASVSKEDLHKSLITVLDASKMGVPKPKDFEKSLKQYINAIGLEAHEDLYKDSFCVSVVDRNETSSFLPSRNEGIKGGFVILQADKIEIPEKSNTDEVVHALIKAIEKCK